MTELKNSSKTHHILWGLIVVLVGSLVFLLRSPQTPSETSSTPKVTLPITTAITAQQKTSKEAPDVILGQTYKAQVNGVDIQVPVWTVSGGLQGSTQGIIKQEVDLTDVVKTSQESATMKAKEKYKKNWEIGVGIGVFHGDPYIPIGIQRNFKEDSSIDLQVNLDRKGLAGGQVMFKRMY